MKDINPFLATDGYKVGHHLQYPQGTELVYSNFTPRSNRYAPKGCDKIVVFGQQMVMREIQDMFEKGFFNLSREEACGTIHKEYSLYLGDDYDVSHIKALHDLGYLPIKVKSLPEGSTSPIGVPVLTIYNTLPEFYWLTNFLETLISNLLWKPMTSATIAYQYKKNLLLWAEKTDKDNKGFVEFQGHNFSMRGMDSIFATVSSGLGHSISFLGEDSLPVIHGAREFYDEEGPVVHSVNATEHSVMCSGTKDDEIGTFRYLMSQFPTGILSVVSDTWDLWKVLHTYLPELKEEILAREGKLVIRPDSGDPVEIICGDPIYTTYTDELPHINEDARRKGVVEMLWDTFGGTINDQGYKVLDPHIGAIYGDSINLERQEQICERLEEKGFASTNIVLGIGSFTYQFNTRDTFGFAMKATYVEVNGEGREIFKDPITDDGTKKSAKGLLMVNSAGLGEGIVLGMRDQCTWEEETKGLLQTIFDDGHFHNQTTLTEIRKRLSDSI